MLQMTAHNYSIINTTWHMYFHCIIPGTYTSIVSYLAHVLPLYHTWHMYFHCIIPGTCTSIVSYLAHVLPLYHTWHMYFHVSLLPGTCTSIVSYLAHVLPLYHTWHMYFHCIIPGTYTSIVSYLAHVLPLYHTWHMYFHRFTRYTILGNTTANSIQSNSVGAALTNSLHNQATELLLHPWTSRSNLTATTVGGVIWSDIKVGSVETVIRFRQGPPEGDNMSVIISIVLNLSDVSTGYIMKNGSRWWCTWV